jgi:hypothetical protein
MSAVFPSIYPEMSREDLEAFAAEHFSACVRHEQNAKSLYEAMCGVRAFMSKDAWSRTEWADMMGRLDDTYGKAKQP